MNVETKQQWLKLFPSIKGLQSDPSFAKWNPDKMTKLQTTIWLPERWNGTINISPIDEEDVLQRVGRWYITPNGLVPSHNNYDIDKSKLSDGNWLYHFLTEHSGTFYDPTDFIDALEEAYSLLFPNSTEADRNNLIQREISTCIERGQTPFYPSRVAGFWYIITSMDEEDQDVFAEYLVDKGYTVSF